MKESSDIIVQPKVTIFSCCHKVSPLWLEKAGFVCEKWWYELGLTSIRINHFHQNMFLGSVHLQWRIQTLSQGGGPVSFSCPIGFSSFSHFFLFTQFSGEGGLLQKHMQETLVYKIPRSIFTSARTAWFSLCFCSEDYRVVIIDTPTWSRCRWTLYVIEATVRFTLWYISVDFGLLSSEVQGVISSFLALRG